MIAYLEVFCYPNKSSKGHAQNRLAFEHFHQIQHKKLCLLMVL